MTPGRFRQRSPTAAQGVTPQAKRPDVRPDPGRAELRDANYTQAELTALMEQFQRSYASDMAWLGTLRDSIVDNANIIDQNSKEIVAMKADMTLVIGVVEANDNNVKAELQANDKELRGKVEELDKQSTQMKGRQGYWLVIDWCLLGDCLVIDW